MRHVSRHAMLMLSARPAQLQNIPVADAKPDDIKDLLGGALFQVLLRPHSAAKARWPCWRDPEEVALCTGPLQVDEGERTRLPPTHGARVQLPGHF